MDAEDVGGWLAGEVHRTRLARAFEEAVVAHPFRGEDFLARRRGGSAADKTSGLKAELQQRALYSERSGTVLDFLGNLRRTHYCGELRAKHEGHEAVVMGWVARRRDLGNLLFLDVRDRTGIVQVVFNKETQPAAHAKAEQARSEFVVAVEGKVLKRQKANPELATGEVELVAVKLHILNNAKTPPFPIEDEINAAEETRLRFRYLDLRRPKPHQILMIGGLDRYFQIVKCFRDEDLRADRQPEFTQLDLEMSFPRQEDIFQVIEKVMVRACAVAGIKAEDPFPHMLYKDAIRQYGSDKPDLRFGMVLQEVTDCFPQEAKQRLQIEGSVFALAAPGAAV